MQRIILTIFLILTVSIVVAQDKSKKPMPMPIPIPQAQDTTVVWQKTADIKANLKYQLDQLEALPEIQQYKALMIQYNLISQIQNDSLKFKKQ